MASAAASRPIDVTRSEICLDCRTLLPSGEGCVDRRHETADLRTGHGREELLARVWGSVDVRDRAKQLLKLGGSGAGFLVLAKTFMYVPFWKGTFVVFGGLLLMASLWWLVTLVHRKIAAHRNRLKPRGGKRAGLGKDTGLVGRVVSKSSPLLSAGSASACLAYDITLHAKRYRSSSIMLRHGMTSGFEVELEDGSRVEVPAGHIRLRGPSRRLREAALHTEFADEHFELVPYGSVQEVVLREGDRVAIHGELDREPLVSKSSAYRHTSWCYRPRAVAGIRILV